MDAIDRTLILELVGNELTRIDASHDDRRQMRIFRLVENVFRDQPNNNILEPLTQETPVVEAVEPPISAAFSSAPKTARGTAKAKPRGSPNANNAAMNLCLDPVEVVEVAIVIESESEEVAEVVVSDDE